MPQEACSDATLQAIARSSLDGGVSLPWRVIVHSDPKPLERLARSASVAGIVSRALVDPHVEPIHFDSQFVRIPRQGE